MVTRHQLHKLLDAVPDSAMPAVEVALRPFVDPMRVALLAASEDDEPSTVEEDASSDGAWQEYQSGDFISAEEAKRRLLG